MLSQKYSTFSKTQLTKTHYFNQKLSIYTALLSSSSSVRFWGHRGTTLEEIYNNNSDNEWWYLSPRIPPLLLARKDETDAPAKSTRVFDKLGRDFTSRFRERRFDLIRRRRSVLYQKDWDRFSLLCVLGYASIIIGLIPPELLAADVDKGGRTTFHQLEREKSAIK